MTEYLVEARDITKTYTLPREKLWQAPGRIEALAGVSLEVAAGRNFGIVGESGSGKSTLARIIMGLEQPDSGTMRVLGQDLAALPPARLRALRPSFQMVFQDPYGSLDPRQTVGKIISEPLAGATPEQVREALESVALRAADAQKYPHEFSGGQRQRIAIARALITRPQLIVADEPVSALDVSVQAQVLNLFQDLQAAYGLTYVFISHDLAVVAHMCKEVAVLYRGRIVERGPAALVFARPAHPYTLNLLEAVPLLAPRPVRRAAVPALPDAGGGGCSYAGPCRFRQPVCLEQRPALRSLPDGRTAACHFAGDIN